MSKLEVERVQELLESADKKILEGLYHEGLEALYEAKALDSQKLEVWYLEGLAYYRISKIQEALEAFTQALELNPDCIIVLAQRGMSYSEVDQPDLAQADLNKAASISPVTAADWYGRSLSLWRVGKESETLEALDEAIKIEPKNPYFWDYRGVVLSDLKREDEAINAYETALKFFPRYARCWRYKGISLYNKNALEDALLDFNKALEIQPTLHSWRWRGLTLYKLGRYEEAITSFDHALDASPEDPVYPDNDRSSRQNRAYALQHLGRCEEAIADYDKILETSPNDYYIWLNRAHCYKALKRSDTARESYERAIQISSDISHAWSGLGDTLFESQRFEEAIAAYDKYLEIKDSYIVWFWRGHAYVRLENFYRAADSFMESSRIDPDDHKSILNRAYCLQRISQHSEAVSEFNRFLEITRDRFYMQKSNSSRWTSVGNPEDAIGSYNQVLSSEPGNCVFWHGKADFLRLLGRFDQAVETFRRGLELNPTYSEGWYGYADTLLLLSREEDALGALEKTIENNNNFARAWSLKAFILVLLKRYDEACDTSDHAIALSPESFIVWAERAWIMSDSSRDDECLRSCEKALELEPETPAVSLRDRSYTKAGVLKKQGDFLAKDNRYEEALCSYKKALEINSETLLVKPNYKDIWNSYGSAAMQLALYKEALKTHEESLAIDNEQLHVWLDRGKAFLCLKKAKEALEAYETVLRIDSGNIEAMIGRFNSLSDLERYEEALKAIDEVCNLSSSEQEKFGSSFLRANALSKMGAFSEALEEHYKLIKTEIGIKFAWFLWSVIGAILAYRDDLDDSGHHIDYLRAVDAYDKSIDVFCSQSVADAEPFNYIYIDYLNSRVSSMEPAFYAKFLSKNWLSKGRIVSFLEDYNVALNCFNSAIAEDNENSEAWLEKGDALRKIGRYSDAVDAYDTYLTFVDIDDDWKTWSNRGDSLLNLKRYKESIDSYRNALKIHYDDHQTWHSLGSSLYAVGRYKKALDAYQTSLEVDARCVSAWIAQGQVLTDLYRYQEALTSYNRAVSLAPDSDSPHASRGWVLSALGSYTDALSAFDTAIAKEDQCWLAWVHKGWTVYVSKSLEEAMEIWDEGLLRLKPQIISNTGAGAEIAYFKGLAHYNEGKKLVDRFSNWKKARSHYQTSLRLLEVGDNKERYLYILKELIKVSSGLKHHIEVDELRRQGGALLARLLEETVDPIKRHSLTSKYVGFEQLTVDSYVQDHSFSEAIETAEAGRDACLSWLFPDSTDMRKALSQEEIYQFLNSSTALIYWHISPVRITAFVVSGNMKISVISDSQSEEPADYGSEEEISPDYRQLLGLESWVNNWNRLYTAYGSKQHNNERRSHKWRTQMSDKFERLRDILAISKIIAQLPEGVKEIILVPHRDLHRFPVHVLFPEDFTITYLPSIRVGLMLKDRMSKACKDGDITENRLLSIESPNSEGENQTKKFVRLGFAALESKVISKIFSTKTIKADKASKEKVKESIQQPYNMLHFAGHAFYRFDSPATSALALTGKDRLTVSDICQEDLILHSYELICLSACETALTGNQSITTEYVGLVSGFLFGGAIRVVSSLWTVQSVSSAFLMIKLYSLMRGGISVPMALRQSQHWLRDVDCKGLIAFIEGLVDAYPSLERLTKKFLWTEINRFSKMPHDTQPFSHPYYWAGFTLTGLPDSYE